MERAPAVREVTSSIAIRPAVLAAMAGDVRARVFGARIPSPYRWVPHDSLEVLPYLIEAEPAVAAVVVDLVRWSPLKAAADIRALRRHRSDLRIVCLYEPGRDVLVQLKALSEIELGLAFAVAPDERFELLMKPVATQRVFDAPTASRSLLNALVPLATSGALETALIHLALAPSHRLAVPDLARIAGCSVDGLERRFAQAGLRAPTAISGLAADAEGLWQVAALNRSARDAARAVGLATGDSLGRMLKRQFGFGLRAARLFGAPGARDTLRWVGLLALRELAVRGRRWWPARARLTRRGGVQPDCIDWAALQLEGAGRAIWEAIADGVPLAQMVDQLSATTQADPVATQLAPGLRALFKHNLVALEWPG